jgi:hypothetical protein
MNAGPPIPDQLKQQIPPLANIWSVVETCCQQSRDVWDFLTACMAVTAERRIMSSMLTLPSDFHAA